jgi:hypothetical protein
MADEWSRVDIAKAVWAARVLEESGREITTARALHYFALGRTDYPVFNPAGNLKGTRTYGDQDADNLTEWVALAKRQGRIEWDRVPDESVGEYCVTLPASNESDFKYSYTKGDHSVIYETQTYLKREAFLCEYSPVSRDQPYHLELWVEKSTMNSILQPVCSRHNAVLVTFKGHCSWGAVWKMCKRIESDGRTALVFYLSDLDSSGFLMGREMCEKFIEINKNFFNGSLEICAKRIGLTPTQVIKYKIPLVERKAKEKANDTLYREYVGAHDLNPTRKAELDALEKYYPGGVVAFVESYLSKYHDVLLESKCRDKTNELLDKIPNSFRLPDTIIQARQDVLRYLDLLITQEASLDIPTGDTVETDLEPDVDDAYLADWLLDTRQDIYPTDKDVDTS